MEVAIQLEGGIAGAGIFCIIIGKFSHWQQPCPVILFIVDKSLEVGIHYIIVPFSLAISLRVEGGRESLSDA